MAVDPTRSEKARVCSVELVRTFHEIKPESLLSRVRDFFNGKTHVYAYYLIFKLRVTSDTGNAHTVFIKTNPDFNMEDYTGNKIQIYCDCADFKYRSAYKLNQRDSLFLTDNVKVALGAALTDTPKSSTGLTPLCKHAVAALNWLVNNYSGIMRAI